MNRFLTGLCAAACCFQSAWALSAPPAADKADKPKDAADTEIPRHLKDEASRTTGTLTIGGKVLGYAAEAGILVVHVKDPMDSDPPVGEKAKEAPVEPEAGMSYVAYFLGKEANPARPITFIYNGGPGSSTVWLHMGAFGPRRVVTADDTHTPAAPYSLVANAYSLLDATDMVFIDAPGTGFSRIAGKDKEKAFWGVDADAHAFSQFILEFLSKYGRWNSPKYLFGESYGTPRSAVVINELETNDDVDFNGVILLSQILNFDLSADGPQFNPGTDAAYVTALPTYAASAWYHNLLPGGRPADLEPFLKQVEAFATGDYAQDRKSTRLNSSHRH